MLKFKRDSMSGVREEKVEKRHPRNPDEPPLASSEASDITTTTVQTSPPITLPPSPPPDGESESSTERSESGRSESIESSTTGSRLRKKPPPPPLSETDQSDMPQMNQPSIIPITKHKNPFETERKRQMAENDLPIDPTSDEPFKFDPNSHIYMANACCELLHYRVAALVVGGIEVVFIAAWMILCGVFYSKTGVDSIAEQAAISGQVLAAIVCIVAIILMWVGVLTERPLLLWPHLVIQVLGIAAGILLTLVAVITMAAGTHIAELVFGYLFGSNNLPMVEKALGPIWPFCLAVIFDFGAAIGIWFYILVRGAYDYLQDKKFFEKHSEKSSVVLEERKSAPPLPHNGETADNPRMAETELKT